VARDRTRRPRRLSPVLVIVVVAVVAFLAFRAPGWWQRVDHPLNHQASIAQAAAFEGVDPYLVAAVINVESGFRETVVSSAGAVGLMQVKPSTARSVARRLGITGKMNATTLSAADTNIRIGTAYLAELIARYHGNADLALAAYNAGITNADRWAAAWDRTGSLSATVNFPETAHYVDEVLTQTADYRALYPDAFPAKGK
jgi:soluble lytic murein transglycosylase